MSERQYLIAKGLPSALKNLAPGATDALPAFARNRVLAHEAGRAAAKQPARRGALVASGKRNREWTDQIQSDAGRAGGGWEGYLRAENPKMKQESSGLNLAQASYLKWNALAARYHRENRVELMLRDAQGRDKVRRAKNVQGTMRVTDTVRAKRMQDSQFADQFVPTPGRPNDMRMRPTHLAPLMANRGGPPSSAFPPRAPRPAKAAPAAAPAAAPKKDNRRRNALIGYGTGGVVLTGGGGYAVYRNRKSKG